MELWDTWQHESPPWLGDRIRSGGTRVSTGALLSGAQSHMTHDSTGALLSGEAGSRAMGYVAAHDSTSCSLSWPHACMRGYPICRVSIVAPGPTSGKVMNPQVGPLYHRLTSAQNLL
jgi:hypothetical protein